MGYQRGMGRPPLNNLKLTIRLTDDQRRRIAALVGNYQVAQFIREAVDNELKRREAEDASRQFHPALLISSRLSFAATGLWEAIGGLLPFRNKPSLIA